MYVYKETGLPAVLADIALAINASIPASPSQEVMASLGICEVIEVSPPGPNYSRGPIEKVNGVWSESWISPTQDVLDAIERAAFKDWRSGAVGRIKVTTAAGNTFDGDEASQGRMARAILGIDAAPAGSTVTWVLADNSIIQAGQDELREALMLAGMAQAAIWVQP